MKLIDETLKNPKTGQWSRKNITSFVSFIFAMVYSLTGSYWADGQVHEFIVVSFLGLSGGMLGVSSWEKFNINKPQ